MSKTIVFIMAFLCTTAFNDALSTNVSKAPNSKEPSITTLIINANVTVVLVDNEQATLEVTGSQLLTKNITLTQNTDTLVIGAVKNKNFKNAGIIYVPASYLQKISVNNQAHVRSLHYLQIPQLEVVINSLCEIEISNIGKLNFIETDGYSFEHSTEIRRLPAHLFLNKKPVL